VTARRGIRLLAGAALIATSATVATGTEPLLLVDREAAHLAAAFATRGDPATAWTTLPREELFAAACASAPPGAVALTVDPPTRRELGRCAASASELVAPIGREAVYLVAEEAEWPDLSSRDLYRALAATAWDGKGFVPNPARRWRDVDPRLPDAVVRVLLPQPGKAPDALFARGVLEAGCRSAPGVGAIFDPDERVRRCTTVRADGAAVFAAPAADPFAWLTEQPPYAVAVVSQAEIARLSDDVAVLPLDGVVPTYSAVADGEYPASWTVHMTLVAATAGAPALDAAVRVAAESGIGPDGAMAAAGLTPLVPAERVALRARLFAAGGW
jgi:phosphate transport system substrate-binding protein